MLPKLKVLREGSHFQSIVDIERNGLMVLRGFGGGGDKQINNISRYSKGIQMKGTVQT
jgi:hypothetical protein